MCLLLLAMGVRALVPAGYMPDTDALAQGKIDIAFCTAAGGATTFALDLADHGQDGHDSAAPAPDCPFGILAHQALDAPAQAVMAVAPLAFAAPAFPSLNRALPALPALGPPLGSRAPPTYLG